jgi:hypothetical protein
LHLIDLVGCHPEALRHSFLYTYDRVASRMFRGGKQQSMTMTL